MLPHIEHLITVIIPMYNESHNIEQCVGILRSQSQQDFTVIFIDDGSTDDTVQRLTDDLQRAPVEFHYEILQQSNRGAAQARETGIRTAKTPYIFTFDADDHITPDFIEQNASDITKYNSDISLPDFQIQQKNSTYKLLHYPDNKTQFIGLECLKYTLGKWSVPGIMCVKKEILIKSYELYKQYNPQSHNYINNDEVINRLNYLQAQLVTRNNAIYSYLCNPNSTTKRINPSRYLMAKNAMILYQLFGKRGDDLSLKMQEEYINILWGLIKYLRKNQKDLPNAPLWIAQIKEMYLFIKPDLKEFKPTSFKLWSRLWLSRFFAIFL